MSEYKIDYCHHDSVTAESRQEYIKREDVINTVSSLVRDEESFVQEYAVDRIKRIPSADVVEVGKAYPGEELEKYGISEWTDKLGQRWVMIERRDK